MKNVRSIAAILVAAVMMFVCCGALASQVVSNVISCPQLIISAPAVNGESEEPAAEATQEPAVEVTAEPAPEVTEEPVPEVTEEPAPAVTEEPAPEVTEEPAPAVTEEPAPAVTEEPVPAYEGAADDAGRKLSVYASYPEGDLHFGDQVTLYAVIEGYDNVAYTLQWQYSTDNVNWKNIAGETGTSMTLTVSEDNYLNYWRFNLDEVK